MRQGLHGAGVTTLRSLEPWVGFKLGNNMEAKYSLASGLRPPMNIAQGHKPGGQEVIPPREQDRWGRWSPCPKPLDALLGPSEKMLVPSGYRTEQRNSGSPTPLALA